MLDTHARARARKVPCARDPLWSQRAAYAPISGAHRVLLPEAWGKKGGGDRCSNGGGYQCWVQDFVAIDASRRAAVDMTMRLPRGYPDRHVTAA